MMCKLGISRFLSLLFFVFPRTAHKRFPCVVCIRHFYASILYVPTADAICLVPGENPEIAFDSALAHIYNSIDEMPRLFIDDTQSADWICVTEN